MLRQSQPHVSLYNRRYLYTTIVTARVNLTILVVQRLLVGLQSCGCLTILRSYTIWVFVESRAGPGGTRGPNLWGVVGGVPGKTWAAEGHCVIAVLYVNCIQRNPMYIMLL